MILVVQFAKSFKDYAMAVVKYNDKIFAIPWEEIKKQCIFSEEGLKDITYCIHKEYITFVLICENTSFVIVYNADTGFFDYIVEGRCIIKATYCSDTVYAIAKINDRTGTINVYKCISKVGSHMWKYEDTGLKKKYRNDDVNDYKLVVAKNDVYIKLENPLNEVEYINHINDNYSMYCMYDYWKNKEIDVFEGEINRDSIFLEFQFGNPLKTVSITHCNNVKFAAGYLKYIVLGDMAYMLLTLEDERNPFLVKDDKELENDYIPDVEYMLDFWIKNTKDKYQPIALLEEMVELCDAVFVEKDSTRAIELFINDCSLCNQYLGESIFRNLGFEYSLKVYNGANELKEILLANSDKNAEIELICSKNKWDDNDRIIIKEILDETQLR